MFVIIHTSHFSGLPVCELQCRPVLCGVCSVRGQSMASFQCADGYSIEGAIQTMCLRNGTWDTEQSNCGNTLIFGIHYFLSEKQSIWYYACVCLCTK
jgi:hypothetical protein